jgi:hypothetical protein
MACGECYGFPGLKPHGHREKGNGGHEEHGKGHEEHGKGHEGKATDVVCGIVDTHEG